MGTVAVVAVAVAVAVIVVGFVVKHGAYPSAEEKRGSGRTAEYLMSNEANKAQILPLIGVCWTIGQAGERIPSVCIFLVRPLYLNSLSH